VPYSHPKTVAFQARLEEMFRALDTFLEDEWGEAFNLHPNRPERGATSNPEMDGLFEAAPDFTPGYGSATGRGYIITVKPATLERVPPESRAYLMDVAARFINEHLSEYFPDRDLKVVEDKARSGAKIYKIVGDFSLGMV
jgi:hypothetical protein